MKEFYFFNRVFDWALMAVSVAVFVFVAIPILLLLTGVVVCRDGVCEAWVRLTGR